MGWWELRSGEMSRQRRGNYPVYCCRPLPVWDRGLPVVPASHHVLVLLLGLLNDLRGQRRCTVPQLGAHTDPGPTTARLCDRGQVPRLPGSLLSTMVTRTPSRSSRRGDEVTPVNHLAPCQAHGELMV